MEAKMPFSQENMNEIFKISPADPGRVISRESSSLEFKESFGWASLAKYQKTSAAYAKAKAALTELFAEARNTKTPVVVERVVNDIDEIVRLVRFPGWQSTKAGEREVQKGLRKIIYVKYKVKDQDLFDKAYGYIRQYY